MKLPKRFFLPCDEWIYFKIYCGELTLDTLLINELHDYIEELNTESLINNWFFIRYYDPDHHIRLRLKVKKSKNSYKIIKTLNTKIEELVVDNFIWKLAISSYDRELERYAWLDYNISEILFHIDSVYFVESLEYLENNELKFLYNFKATLDFIALFYTTDEDRLDFIKAVETSYKKEFKLTKIAQKQLSLKYRSLKATIADFLSDTNNGDFNMLRNALSLKVIEIKELLGTIHFPKTVPEKFSFVFSHIHMNTNRIFATNQRLYEMITYDHLYRYCNSLTQRNNS